MKFSLLAFVLLFTAIQVQPAAAFRVTPLSEESIVVELTTQATSRDQALSKAKQEAILGTVGRVFLEKKLLMADEILYKYIGNYANQFIDAQEVLEEKYVAGENIIKSRVFVNFANLEQDLTEKRFIYRPAYKPLFTTFLTERLDGRISNDGVARRSLMLALQDLGMRSFGAELQTPPSTTDIRVDDFLLNAATISAQRSGVEIIITGEADTKLIERKKLYFDEYWFYETEVTASLVRVDTKEVLVKASAKGSASEKDQEEAIGLSLDRANAVVAQRLFDQYQEFWPNVIQLESDYEILFTGVNEELTSIIIQNLERLGSSIKVTTRKSFDRSTVLSVEYDGPRELLIENLSSCPYPTLYILNPEAETGFEVQVSN
ncbi:MAG: hypothetical protein ACFCU1_05175 [Sumerlaeia bacterium]